LRHATGAADDFIALRVGQLSKLRASFHLAAMIGHEPFQTGFKEAYLGPPVDHESTRHKALPPPTGHRPRGDVVFLADLADRQHRLDDLLDRLPDSRRQVLHEQPQVALDLGALEHQGRPRVRPEARDPEADVIVRVALRLVDLAEQLLGPLQLLDPPLLGGEPSLLVLELLHRGVAVRLTHAPPPCRERLAQDSDPG